MRSITCVLISGLCWYIGFNMNKGKEYMIIHTILVIAGFITLLGAILLMILGL